MIINNTKTSKFYKIVHCEWDEWQIGECSKTCGGGERTDTRVEKASAEHGGDACKGAYSLTESCNVEECPGKTILTIMFLVRYLLCFSSRNTI